MKTILLFTIIINIACAVTVDLESILSSNSQKDRVEKMLEENYISNKIEGVADSQTSPLLFNSTLYHSDFKPLLSKFEYEIGFSKELKLGNVQELEEKSSLLNSEATKIEGEKRLIELDNQIKNIYNQYCLEREYLSSFSLNYNEFDELYQKKNKSYQLGEISRLELLKIELKKDELSSRIDNFSKIVEDKKRVLLSLGNFNVEDSLSCLDMTPIDGVIEDIEEFSLTNSSYEKRVESSQVELNRYSKNIDSIEISTSYTKEIDRDLYSVGVSIPLNMSSKKYEYKKASIMHKISAVEHQKELFIEQSRLKIEELKLELKRIYNYINRLEQNIQKYNNSLLPLERKSYNYGESSIVEYILAKQNIINYKEQLLDKKREYYNLLFRAYILMEKR